MKKKYTVYGMTCKACSISLEKEVSKIKGIKNIYVSLIDKALYVESDYEIDDLIKDAIVKAGFNYEQKDNKKIKNILFIISIIAMLIVMYLCMGHFININIIKNNYINTLLQFIFTLFIIIINKDMLILGFKKLFKSPNMSSLVFVSSFASFSYSIYLSIMYFITKNIHYFHEYTFDSVVMILTFVSIGKKIEEIALSKTKKDIENMVLLKPCKSVILKDDKEHTINTDDLKTGDILVLKKGDLISADGTIIKGEVLVSDYSLTGESFPKAKTTNDYLYASTTISDGYANMLVDKPYNDSSISKIVDLVTEASNSKANISKIVDKLSFYFTPFIILLSIIIFIVNILINKNFNLSFNFFISTLIISCPCALGLAIPCSIVVASGVASRNRLYIKNASVLERIRKIDTMIFDKTGTLTFAKLEVKKINTTDENLFKTIIYNLESYNEHIIAKTIIDYYKFENIEKKDVKDYKLYQSLGIRGLIDGKAYYVGNHDFLSYYHKNIEMNLKCLEVFLFTEEKIIGSILLQDKIKDSAYTLINKLKQKKIDVIIASGDNYHVTKDVANKLNVSKFYSNLLPEDKKRIIDDLKKNNHNICMIGDGTNDSYALSKSDLGISFSNASSISYSNADIILLSDDIIDILKVIKLAKHTFYNIRLSLFWAFIYNLVALLFTSGIFYYAFNIKLNPMISSLCMSISSILVVLNALSLNLVKFKNNSSTHHYKLYVSNMMCKHCYNKIKNILKKITDVTYFKINLKNKIINIKCNDINLIISILKDNDYNATIKEEL